MANETIVKFDRIRERDNTYYFKTIYPKKYTLWVTAFNDGIATIEIPWGENIFDFAAIVLGCFEETSNFEDELLAAFKCDANTKFKGVYFEVDSRRKVTLIKDSELPIKKQLLNALSGKK